jgi:hypothetical protein
MTKFLSELLPFVPRKHKQKPLSKLILPSLDDLIPEPVKEIAPPLVGEVFLAEIAMYFRKIPYGYFRDFCAATGASEDALWEWCNGRETGRDRGFPTRKAG